MLWQLTLMNECLLDVCIINDYRDALINQVHGEVGADSTLSTAAF